MDSIADKRRPAINRPYLTVNISIILFLCSAFVILLVSFNEMLFSIFVIFIFLTVIFFIAVWICTSSSFRQYRKEIFLIFYFTILINILAMVFSSYMFQYNIGLFTGANDETRMYIEGNLQGSDFAHFFEMRPYPFYFYCLSIISHIARSLGGNSPFNFKLLSIFFGGCIPAVIFAHYIRKYPLEKIKKIALLSGLFPGFIYFSSIGVRDIIIIFLTGLFFFLLINKRKTWKRTILLLAVIFWIFLLRLVHAAFCSATYFLYFAIQSYKKLSYLKIAFAIFFSAVLLVGAIQFQRVLRRFIRKEIIQRQEFYREILMRSLRTKNTMESSLTYRIRGLPVPLNHMGIYAYNILNNFPPYLLLESKVISSGTVGAFGRSRFLVGSAKLPVSYGRIFKALGPLVWYFILPYVLLGLFLNKDRYGFDFDEKFIIWLCFLYLFAVSIFTTDIGRIVVVYANLIPFGLIVRYKSPAAIRQKVDLFTCGGVFLLFTVYFILKFVL
jgi:hypothetical protein